MSAQPTMEAILADVLNLPATSITGELAMRDLDEWDSLKHMELIAALEQAYGIELTFDEIIAMRDVSSIRRVLESRADR